MHNSTKVRPDNFSGAVILPGDETYPVAASTLFNQGRPEVVLRALTSADVAAAIRHTNETGSVLAVRSGGHSAGGFGTRDGGTVLDLSLMNRVTIVDAGRGIVRVQPGATWGVVAGTLSEEGLALTSGDTASVGVGGLTVGGGIGWMVRRFGLTIDSLVAAEIVGGNGEILRTDDDPDLLWAIRGGGGNMGVVTEFTFSAVPISTVYAGTVTYRAKRIGQLLAAWRAHIRSAPEDLTESLTLVPGNEERPPSIMVGFCHIGSDSEKAARDVEPLLQLGEILSHDIGERRYADLLEGGHKSQGPTHGPMRVFVDNTFLKELDDTAIDRIVRAYESSATMLHVRHMGGAVDRIDPDSSAFAHRGNEAFIMTASVLPSDVSDNDIREAAAPWNEVASLGRGAYINFLSNSSEKEVRKAYPPAVYDRLARIKRRYDPKNLFSRNLNVPPASSPD